MVVSSQTATKKRNARQTPNKASAASKANAAHNQYPHILVHGFAGFGRDEVLSQYFHYWGGLGDIEGHLTGNGHPTFTASVGPFSSNWDRACELYAFLKGGVVDYGAVHSARHGHARYGRSYPGIFPEVSDTKKIHLIGHSMGAPTCRMLIQLLEHGDPDEMAFKPSSHEAGTSDLFKGGKHWVHSMTSVAGVNNGTPVADDLGKILSDLIIQAATTAGVAKKEILYDFDLQHWGIQRNDGELLIDYIKRVMQSKVWTSIDCAVHDLSLAAAHPQNLWVQTSENVYYASYAAEITSPGPLGMRIAQPNINPLLLVGCTMIGTNKRDMPDGAEAWRLNDGCVPLSSAQFPFGHKHEVVVPGKALSPKKGVWYIHPTLEGKDHIAVVMPSGGTNIEELNALYLGIAQYNQALE